MPQAQRGVNHAKIISFMIQSVAEINLQREEAYLVLLEQLGAELSKRYTDERHRREQWLSRYLSHLFPRKLALTNPLAFSAIEEAWRDDYLKSMRVLSPKSKLNQASRHHIKLGMQAVALSTKVVAQSNSMTIQQQDDRATQAIANFQTPLQVYAVRVGKVLALIMAMMCGLAAGVTTALLLSHWSLFIVLPTTLLVSAATIMTYWLMYKPAVSQVLIDIVAKDRWFSGWLSYYDQETGEKTNLSRTRQWLLALSTLFAASVGLSSGALIYDFLSKISQLAIVSSLGLGSVLPSILVILTCIFSICSTALNLNAFVWLLREKSLTDFFIRPIKALNSYFDKKHDFNNHESKECLQYKQKLMQKTLVVMLMISLFGLLAQQIQSATSLITFINAYALLTPAASATIGTVVSLGFALVGQIPFTIQSCLNAATNLASDYVVPQPARTVSDVLGASLVLVSSVGYGIIILKAFNNVLFSSAAFAGAVVNVVTSVSPWKKNLDDQMKLNNARNMRVANVTTFMNQILNQGRDPEKIVTTLPARHRYYQHYFMMRKPLSNIKENTNEASLPLRKNAP